MGAVDVYAFSMIAFELFEGWPPFVGVHPVDAARRASLHNARPQWGKVNRCAPAAGSHIRYIYSVFGGGACRAAHCVPVAGQGQPLRRTLAYTACVTRVGTIRACSPGSSRQFRAHAQVWQDWHDCRPQCVMHKSYNISKR